MKKSNMKSPWTLLLIILMILSFMIFLTSCGSGQDNIEEDNDQVEDGPEEDISSILSELDEPDEYYYKQTINAEGYGDSTQEFWFKDDKMKIKGEQEGVPYIMIWTEEYLYNLDPETNTAVRSVNKGDVDIDSNFENTLEVEPENDRNLKYLGSEKINGQPCYIVETTYSEDNTVNKLWIHENHGIIMKSEIIDSTGEVNAVTEVTNLKIGDVSDDEFLIPGDYEFINY